MENSYYMIYNTKAKEYQFPNIFCQTEEEARKRLFDLIGNDALKWRFKIKKVTWSQGRKIQDGIIKNTKARRIMSELPKMSKQQALDLVSNYA